MTAYKRPVFFDRDIKSFSELSADSGLDLGIVARSILADAALQVGTTGSAGTVSVKNASDVTTVELSAFGGEVLAKGAITSGAFGGFGGSLGVVDSTNRPRFVAEYDHVSLDNCNGLTVARLDGELGGAWDNPIESGRLSLLTNADGAPYRETVNLSSSTATATLGGDYVPGVVSLKNGSNTETIRLTSADSSATFGPLTVNGTWAKISGLDTAQIVDPGDAASKAYVDSIAQGLNIKGACHVSSQGNLADLATTTEVDGHTLSLDERVLVRYQELPEQNGIYRFDGAGLVRSADMADGSHAAGAFTFVQFGTNADQGWVCTADAPADVVGTDALPWTQFSAAGVIEAGDGLQLIGTVMSAKLDGSTLAASASGLKVLGLPAEFQIDGYNVAATVTSENLGILTGGMPYDAAGLHSHFADQFQAAESGMAVGKAAIFDSSGNLVPAGTTASGAWCVGIATWVAEGAARVTRGGIAPGVISGATPGQVYYVQADGTLATSLPTSGRVIMAGVAFSATELYVQIRDFGSILA